MPYVSDDDFRRILEMGIKRGKREARDAQNRVLRRSDKTDRWFTVICSIAGLSVIALVWLRLYLDLRYL